MIELFSKIDEKIFLEPPCLEVTKSENHQNRRSFYSRYFRNFHVFWQFSFGWLQLRETSVCVTFRYSSLKNHHPSGTTMRRACELVARQGLLCRGASKIDVCSSVRRSFVRSYVRSFFGQFRNRSNGVTKGKTLENRLKNGPKVWHRRLVIVSTRSGGTIGPDGRPCSAGLSSILPLPS